jgi:chromate reductase
MDIIALSGSTRAGSLNTALLDLAVDRAPAGVEVEVWRSHERVPRVDATRGVPFPVPVAQLRERVHRCDALVIATPELNRSIPGVLKDVVDWLSISAPPRPLVGKPVLLLSASPQRHGGISAQVELAALLFRAGARVLTSGEVTVGAAHERLGIPGRADDGLAAQLDGLWDLLVPRVVVRAEAVS